MANKIDPKQTFYETAEALLVRDPKRDSHLPKILLNELSDQTKRIIYSAMERFLSSHLEEKISELEKSFLRFGQIVTKRSISKEDQLEIDLQIKDIKQ